MLIYSVVFLLATFQYNLPKKTLCANIYVCSSLLIFLSPPAGVLNTFLWIRKKNSWNKKSRAPLFDPHTCNSLKPVFSVSDHSFCLEFWELYDLLYVSRVGFTSASFILKHLSIWVAFLNIHWLLWLVLSFLKLLWFYSLLIFLVFPLPPRGKNSV